VKSSLPVKMSPALLLWTGLSTAAAPALRLLLRRRARRGKEIPDRLAERRGIDPTPRPPGTLIWLHAASVGETMSVLPVLAELAQAAPEAHILFTTGTVTSARLLTERLQANGLHNRVTHRFLPLDVPNWVSRFLEHWKPDVAGFVESELWPNLLTGCRRRHVPLVLINARLSLRSFKRWRRMRGLIAPMIDAVTEVQAQSEVDAHRFRALGAAKVTVPGNLKFAAPALPADTDELARLRAVLGARPAWVAASTHPGEEAAIFAAHRDLAARHPGLLTILVPRHPERGAAIAAEAAQAGVTASQRSLNQPPPEQGVWIADTLGELGLWYRLAPIAFVGRSLIAPGGGQNPLEPARLGCAVATGPHTANFPDAVAVLAEAGALALVADATGLAAWVDAMLRAPGKRAAMGEAGAAACARHGELPALLARDLLALAAGHRARAA
jgi:3-deoxy-D-manno-octulosonic-acid transferase